MKKIIGVFLSLCLMFSVVSCESIKKENKSSLKGNLKVVTYGIYEQYLRDAGELFKVKNPEVNITIDTIDYRSIDNNMENIFKSKPYDIVTLPYYRVQYYGKKYKGSIKALNKTFGEYSKDFNAERVSSIFVDGEEVAIPLDALPVAMMYRNKDLVDLGINKEDIITWNDLLNIGMKLKEKGKRLFSISMHERSSIYGLLINELGIDYLNKNEEPTLASEKSIKALELIKQLVDNELVYEINNEEDGVKLFKDGKTTFMLTIPTLVNYFKDVEENKKNEYRLMKLPSFEPGGNNCVITSGNNLMIVDNENSELSEKFISFATMDKDCLLNGINKYTMMPSYKPIYSSTVFDKKLETFNQEPVYGVFEEIVNYSYIRGVIPNFKVVDEYMEKSIKEIIKLKDIKNEIEPFEVKLSELIEKSKVD